MQSPWQQALISNPICIEINQLYDIPYQHSLQENRKTKTDQTVYKTQTQTCIYRQTQQKQTPMADTEADLQSTWV